MSPQSAYRRVVKDSYIALHYDVKFTVLWGFLANSGALISPAVAASTECQMSVSTVYQMSVL